MQNIFWFFKTKSSIILDEIDMTMDPKREHNFSTEEIESYSMIAAALIAADLMEYLVFDNETIENGLSIHSNNQASLTPEQFYKCHGLVLIYINTRLKDPESMWHTFIIINADKNVTITEEKTLRSDNGTEYTYITSNRMKE